MSKELDPSDPCFGCGVKVGLQVRRASCCWDIDELNIPARQERLFARHENVEIVGRVSEYWMGERILVAIDGACPQLDQDTGACKIQDYKPLACGELEVGGDWLCARTKGGRYAEAVMSWEEVR